MSQSLQAFYEVAEEDLRDKNDDQIRRWKNPRIKAIANFLKVHRDMPLAEITTEDMFAFRKWWVDRTMKGDGKADTADKDLTHLIGMWKRVARSKGLQLGYQTEGLMLRSGKDKDDARPPFSLEWIRDKLIVPDALARMNGDARLILLGMINTGYRPGEGAGLAAEDIKLDAAIPHIIIRPNKIAASRTCTPSASFRLWASAWKRSRPRRRASPATQRAVPAYRQRSTSSWPRTTCSKHRITAFTACDTHSRTGCSRPALTNE